METVMLQEVRGFRFFANVKELTSVSQERDQGDGGDK